MRMNLFQTEDVIGKVSVIMGTKGKGRKRRRTQLPINQQQQQDCSGEARSLWCGFEGYDSSVLMSETAKLRKLFTKRGTLVILIPLCCTKARKIYET